MLFRRKVDESKDPEPGIEADQSDAETGPPTGDSPDADPVSEAGGASADEGGGPDSGSVAAEAESAADATPDPEDDPAPMADAIVNGDPSPGAEPATEDAPPPPGAEPAAEDAPPAPGPVAHHSPEPQTPAERLTLQQQEIHGESPPDPKALLKERREASKRQRKADKEKRKADKKAAKEARKALRKSEKNDPLSLDPLSPTSPDPATPKRPADPPAGSPAAGIAAAAAETERIDPAVDLPPITPPGGSSDQASRRTAALIGGIDLGGTKIAAAVLDANHKVISYRRRPTPDRGGPADVVRAMALTMQEAAIDAGTEAHKLLAVGVGSPGSVNARTGAVSGAGNLPGWDGTFQLGMALREELGTEVRVGNDVQVGTRGEYELGAGAGYSSLLGVFWGTGVGGGIIINGEPWLGRGRAGEIGHTLVRRGGARGLNGLNGTVEAYAGRKAMEAKALREIKKGRKTKLFKLMKKHDKTHLTSAIWQRALDDGDELAEDLLNRAVAALSAGIASAINLLDPEAVVIGGGLGVRFGDTLVPEIVEGMSPYLLNKENPPPVMVAGLGDEGGVIGASLLVAEVLDANDAPSA